MDKKATGDEEVSWDVLKFLGEDSFKLTMRLINNRHETGGWPKDFIEDTMIALKKEPKGTKMQRPSHSQPHCTYSKDSSDNT
jgi:hypothetical protein